MAEPIKIAELKIDEKSLITSLAKTKKSIDELAETQKELKKAGDTNSITFVENETKLKSLRTEYNKQQKVIQSVTGVNEKLTTALTKEINTTDKAKENNAELRKIRNQVNETTEEGAKAIEQINARIDQNTKFINKNSDSYEKQKQEIGAYTRGINAAKVGTRAFGAVLKALGIGLIIAGIAKLTEAFQRNQKVANTISTVFNVIGIIFDKVVGSIVDAVSATTKATGGFDALGRVLKNLLTIALTPIQLSFFSIKAGIIDAQLAWEKSFFGGKDQAKIKELTKDLDTTKEKITELAVNAIQSGKNIANDFGEAISEVGSLASNVATSVTASISSIDLKKVIKDANDITSFKNNIESLIIQQERLKEQYETQAERLRQIRDDESLTIEQRKQANEELNSILDKQAQAELAIIDLKIKGAQQEASLNKGNIELQNEVLRFQNERFELENRITGQKSEQLANQNALNKEELEQIKAFEQQKKELKDQIALENAESDKEKELLKLEQDYEKQLLELELMQLNEQQKTELLALMEEQRNQQLADIQSQYRNEEIKADKALLQSKLAARRQTLDGILALVNEESEIGKMALVAKQILALKEFAIESGLFQSKVAMKGAEATADISGGVAKTASVGFPQNIPLLAAFIGQTAGIVGSIMGVLGIGKKKPKFQSGGILKGNSHYNGGIQTPFGELEGEEAVINKKSTAMFAPLLSKINEAGGGRKFATGGILGTESTVSSSFIDYDLLATKIANANMSLPNPVVSVEEITTVGNRVGVIERGANL